MRDLGNAVDGSMNRARQHAASAGHALAVAAHGRLLTVGERRMITAMFGPASAFGLARVYARNYWWPYPNDRAMTPDGNIYFPHSD